MSKGITLIEVVVGLAIISLGVLSIIAVFPFAVKNLELDYRSNSALFLASNRIEELTQTEYENVEMGTFVEDFGEIQEFDNYKRETTVNCFHPQNETCSEDTGLKKVTVTVFSKGVGNNSSTSLTTLIVDK